MNFLRPVSVCLLGLIISRTAWAGTAVGGVPASEPLPPSGTQFYKPLEPGQKPPGSEDADVTSSKHRVSPDDPKLSALHRALVGRVQARWDAVIARDFEKAYAFETPAYRSDHSAQDYAGQFGNLARWHVAKVRELRYNQPEAVEVVVNLDYSFNLPGVSRPVRTQLDILETWVHTDQEWWRRTDITPLMQGSES